MSTVSVPLLLLAACSSPESVAPVPPPPASTSTACLPELVCAVPPPGVADAALGLAPYEVPLPRYMDPMPVPADNPLTHAGVALGRRLFYEPLLSGNDTQSCSSCHEQARSFTDGKRVSVGSEGRPLERNAMALVNLAWTAPYFWDGRVDSLEALVPIPLQHPDELNESIPNLVAQLAATPTYPPLFEAAFPGEGISEDTVSKSIAQFLRTLVSFNSRADMLDSGRVSITALEQQGNSLMTDGFPKGDPERTADMCDACHEHSAGVRDAASEMGLFTTSESKNNGMAADERFIVPTIRNIAVTGPYMHDGRFETLAEVLVHYDSEVVLSDALEEPLLHEGEAIRLGTDEADREALVAVLGIFTDEVFLTNPAFSAP